jgi:hypothetical protein
MIISRRISWARHAARIGMTRIAQRLLIRDPEGKRVLKV